MAFIRMTEANFVVTNVTDLFIVHSLKSMQTRHTCDSLTMVSAEHPKLIKLICYRVTTRSVRSFRA